jgi:7-carboxy-7-deazaguanine synthase
MSKPGQTVLTGPAAVGTLPIAEIFGPTFQGEGPSLGMLAGFVRLGGCNLTCRDCDTPFTWDASRYNLRNEIKQIGIGEILGRLDEAAPDVPLVVVTGGEPLLYQGRSTLKVLLGMLVGRGQRIEVETNGTIAPGEDMYGHTGLSFNVSPKLAGAMSDDDEAKRINADALAEFAALARYRRAVFKFVCRTVEHVDEAAALVAEHRIPRQRVWIMPEGVTPETINAHGAAIADTVLGHRFNMTTRLHIQLWPKIDRGR